MKLESVAMACILACVAGCSVVPKGNNDDWVPQGTWVEVWRDDFDGVLGAAPDPTNWRVVTIGNPPNGELEYYTDRRDNSFLDGDGHLVLRALSENYMGRLYTSAKLDSRGLQENTYGRFEARIQLPAGPGLWPAFWLLGSIGGWPACGEIDIMENGGSKPTVIRGTLHGPQYFGGEGLTKQHLLTSGTFADGFHVFAVEWTHDGIRWLVDEESFEVHLRSEMEALGKTWVFDAPFHMILNLAVGGAFDGPPTSETPFPSDMSIDYVKVSRLDP
jgi:beta-glucanase (GH16 family)